MNLTNTQVPGDKIVTPAALVQIVFDTRLATEEDYKTGFKEESNNESKADSGDDDEEDVAGIDRLAFCFATPLKLERSL